MPPVINSISPTRPIQNQLMSIQGLGFGTEPGKVTLNGMEVAAFIWIDNKIVVCIPTDILGSMGIVITNSAGEIITFSATIVAGIDIISSGHIWNEPSVITDIHEINQSKKIINLNHPYTPGSGDLTVIVNGSYQFRTTANNLGGYYEINPYTIEFEEFLVPGDVVVCSIRRAS